MSGPIPAAVDAAAANYAAQAQPMPAGMSERTRRRFDHVRAGLLARVSAGNDANRGAAQAWARMGENVRLLLALTVAGNSGATAQGIALARWSDLDPDTRRALAANARTVHRETAAAHLLLA